MLDFIWKMSIDIFPVTSRKDLFRLIYVQETKGNIEVVRQLKEWSNRMEEHIKEEFSVTSNTT